MAESAEVELDFGGDVIGSVSKYEKKATCEFFGIKKRQVVNRNHGVYVYVSILRLASMFDGLEFLEGEGIRRFIFTFIKPCINSSRA